MADPNLSRQLASSVIEALKQAGHVLIAKGKSETLLRELGAQIEPTLVKVIPRILRSEITGEVTSTFGDEATDEAVEELVERLREQLIDSEGIEDIFADDKVIDRVIFRTLHEGLVQSAHVAREEDEEDAPPISVRLDTLGYVASTASKLTDSVTLKDALERAALSASTELDTFDAASRTAFFAASDDDPDKRLEIEEAVEEELADLVEMGLVDLPTVVHRISLRAPIDAERQKTLRKAINEMAARALASRVCPGTWDWEGAAGVKLTFTPMSQPDAKAVDGAVAQFSRELDALLAANEETADARADVDEAPRSSRARVASGPKSVAPKSVAPKSVAPKSVVPKAADETEAESKKPVSKKPVSKKADSEKSVSKKAVSKKAVSKKADAKKADAKKEAATGMGGKKAASSPADSSKSAPMKVASATKKKAAPKK